MVNVRTVPSVTEEQARRIMEDQLPMLLNRMSRDALRNRRRGREAYAEHDIMGSSLFSAAAQLRDDFEAFARTHIGEAWKLTFGYSRLLRAPSLLMLRLK